MRRAAAAVVLGLSLWLGSMAWSGFVMTRTVLDPDRSQQIAESLYENDAVRAQLSASIAAGLARTIPPGVPVGQDQLELAAEVALDSPAVEALIVDAFVRTHGAFLGEGEAPSELDAGAFGAAARDALVAGRPELDGVLPQAPEIVVDLPTERVPDFGGVRSGLQTAVPAMALAAVAGALLALAVSSNRPAVLRRAGFWAIGLSATVLIFAFGIPAAAERFAPDHAEVIAALIGALAAATRGPAVALAASGVAALVISAFWKAAPAVLPTGSGATAASAAAGTGAAAAAPGVRRGLGSRSEQRGVPERGGLRSTGGAAGPATSEPLRRREPDGFSRRQVAPPPDPAPDYPKERPRPASPPGEGSSGGRRWVDGVGWVLEAGAGEVPPDARWVPGVGYVVDD